MAEGKDGRLCKRWAWAVTPKNALVHLNELQPGLRYEVAWRSGPLHAPLFAVGVDVNGSRFEGRGVTVKQAKLRAAELALRSFVQFPNASQALATMGDLSNTFTDFAADQEEPRGPPKAPQAPPWTDGKQVCNYRPLVRLRLVPSSQQQRAGPPSGPPSGPCCPLALLHQLQPGLSFTCLVDRAPRRPARRFVMVLRVEGRVFEGCGSSKRAAKAQAAAAALESICNISLGPQKRLLGFHGNSTKTQLPQVSVCVFACECVCTS